MTTPPNPDVWCVRCSHVGAGEKTEGTVSVAASSWVTSGEPLGQHMVTTYALCERCLREAMSAVQGISVWQLVGGRR